MKKTFLDFLREKHSLWYMGTDDNMPADFENWLSDTDSSSFIDYADEFMAEEKERISKEIDGYYDEISVKDALKIINK